MNEFIVDIRWVIQPGYVSTPALEVKYGRIEDGRLIETTPWRRIKQEIELEPKGNWEVK